MPAYAAFGETSEVDWTVNILLALSSAVGTALVFLTGCGLRYANALKAFILLVAGLQSLLIFGEASEVDWTVGAPLALGSAVGAYAASLLATRNWTRVWVYRFLVLVVVLAIVHLLIVDTREFLGRGGCLLHY